MKSTKKTIESKRMLPYKPWCISGHKQLGTREQIKGEIHKSLELKPKKAVINMIQLNKSLKPNTGEEKELLALKQDNYLKENLESKMLKKQKEKKINKNEFTNNKDDKKKMKKISSKTVFSRKFSKYNDLIQQKLKLKFKSNYQSSGKFDQSFNKYKAYVNKNRSKKNKSLFKYSMCSFGFNKEIKKSKHTVLCPDLPGKGTYNHRFVYDEALQLHRKGVDVDVLYKVKNKTDSIYVINGEFLWTKNARSGTSNISSKRYKKGLNNEQNRDKLKMEELIKSQKLAEEEIMLKEYERVQKEKEKKKMRLAVIASKQRFKAEREKIKNQEELQRKQNMKEIEKQLRAEQLTKMLMKKMSNENKFKQKKKINDKKLVKKHVDKKQELKDQQEQMKIDNLNAEAVRLRRLKIKQNLEENYKRNKNAMKYALEINPLDAFEDFEVITDPSVINDIERWVLRNDGTVHAISWLKTVTGRIDSLDGRVDISTINKWTRMAIDKVVDIMTGKNLLSDFSKQNCNQGKLSYNIKSSSCCFKIKSKRTLNRCHKILPQPMCGIVRSPKFTACTEVEKKTLHCGQNDRKRLSGSCRHKCL